ncbi:MAG: glycosyltransferase, partial [Planctomycetota bacterium]
MSRQAVETRCRPDTPASQAQLRRCDGVVCFGGEDWWYHNRGHYDMQMMRRFAGRVPTLYVNSIGMRTPRVGEGRMFLRRVTRKLRSLGRGLAREAAPGMAVYSPLAAPGGTGGRLSRRLLAAQVGRAARRVGVRRPLLWVACPPGVEVLEQLRPQAVVYQRTDRYEAFTGVDPVRIAAFDRRLKRRADLTLFCSRALFEAEANDCRRAAYVEHGVDYDRFARAGAGEEGEPADMADLPRPRVGFIGGIDAHTFDPELFRKVAASVPEATFVLVGACSLPEGWLEGLDNVVALGQKPYEAVAACMAACDVLIMPWNRSEWIQACNPVKLKEYLAVGRPIVSTPFRELEAYGQLVRVAQDAAGFVQQVREALADDAFDPEPGRAFVRSRTWDAQFEQTLALLREAGV